MRNRAQRDHVVSAMPGLSSAAEHLAELFASEFTEILESQFVSGYVNLPPCDPLPRSDKAQVREEQARDRLKFKRRAPPVSTHRHGAISYPLRPRKR